jgi:hypothetical protein
MIEQSKDRNFQFAIAQLFVSQSLQAISEAVWELPLPPRGRVSVSPVAGKKSDARSTV